MSKVTFKVPFADFNYVSMANRRCTRERPMTKTKRQPPKWHKAKADAYTIARIIADQLDHEDGIDIGILNLVAEGLADAFEFTDEERDEFVGLAMVNHDGTEGEINY